LHDTADTPGSLRAGPHRGLSFHLALALMRWGSRSSRFGHRECYTSSFVRALEDGVSVATHREFDDGTAFFDAFEGIASIRDLANKDVLDLGCGHGGRSAYYATQVRSRSIVGLAISFDRVSVANESAHKLSTKPGLFFLGAFGERLPFVDASFDAILSYDVFEHVSDLRLVLRECHRVLRPGGRLYALFPPYYGPRAHHLDFVTTLPFLHYFFSPAVLVAAANQVLRENPGLRDAPLPAPSRSYLGREVLARLNGTTLRDFRELIAHLPFIVEHVSLLPFARGSGGVVKRVVRAFCRAMLQSSWPFRRDPFVSSIRCVLTKRGRPD
jgi:SAM-dependent methyltransferase